MRQATTLSVNYLVIGCHFSNTLTTLMYSHCPKNIYNKLGHLHFLLDEMGLDKTEMAGMTPTRSTLQRDQNFLVFKLIL